MAWIDWIILISTLGGIVGYGYWKTKNIQSSHTYFKGEDNTRWWTVGLSVMATQASAITFMSTPGQAFFDGMGFVQIYFGLPIAMVIICVTFIPLYQKLKVYTAYEFLEKRFDLKTRLLTASLFLIQRGMAAGITIYAPSIILSTVLGWDINMLNIIIGFLVIVYTVSGGSAAVNVTQKQQMFVIMAGMFFVFFYILTNIHQDIDFASAMKIAASAGKTDILDFSWNPESRYTIWSGLAGGLFLSLSYFGTDQSQVQRYLSGNSIKESRLGLIFNGLLKVPMQFFILLTGVLVFVFYQFHPSPLFFNKATVEKIKNTEFRSQWENLETQKDSLYILKKENLLASGKEGSDNEQLHKIWNSEKKVRESGTQLIQKALPDEEINDKDYVFIHFILEYLPAGLIGLLLAVIFSAAMSSTSAELNALATTTCIDMYKRNIRPEASDAHYLTASKWFTVLWGIIAIIFASVSTLFENLIQLVNIVGSIFYGTILGIFLIAFYFRRLQAGAVFPGAITGQILVLIVYFTMDIGYLWLNTVGLGATLFFSMLFSVRSLAR